MESQAELKAENERLKADMANMKKKIMVAFKKQQEQLQAKLSAVEKSRDEAMVRAQAAETAAKQAGTSDSLASRMQEGKSEAGGHTERELSMLRAQSKECMERAEVLECELQKVRSALEAEVAMRSEDKAKLEELRNSAAAHADLEAQLMEAARQASEARERASNAEAQLRTSMKAEEVEKQLVEMRKEHQRALTELQETKALLLQEQHKSESKEQVLAALTVSANEDSEKHSQTLMEMAGKMNQLEMNLAAAEEARTAAEKIAAGLRENLEEVNSGKSSESVLGKEEEDLAEEVAELRLALAKAQVTVKTAEGAVLDKEGRAVVLANENEKLQHELSAQSGRLEQLRVRLEEAEKALDVMREKGSERESEVEKERMDMKAELERRTSQLTAAEAEVLTLRSHLEMNGKGGDDDVHESSAKVAALSALLSKQQSDFTVLRKDLEVAQRLSEEQLAKALLLVEEKTGEMLTLQTRLDEAASKASALEGDLVTERERVTAYEGKGALHQDEERNELNATVKQLQEELAQLKELSEDGDQAGLSKELKLKLEAADRRAMEAEKVTGELREKLADAEKRLEEEIKSHEEKLAEMNEKLGRLQKRAKQRIQEIQKEKEEIETQVVREAERVAASLSTQAQLQEEVQRARGLAAEAQKVSEEERGALKSQLDSLKVEVEELHREMESKEKALGESRKLAAAKEQTVLELTEAVEDAKKKSEEIIADLTQRLQEMTDLANVRVTEAAIERTKISDHAAQVQARLAETEARLTEVESAKEGEAARFGALVEELKGKLKTTKEEQEAERETAEAETTRLKAKLEAEWKARKRLELTVAEAKTTHEADLERQKQECSSLQSQLAAAQAEYDRLQSEMNAYKVRAHALLQKKQAELNNAKDTEQVAAQEEALREAKEEAAMAASECEKLRKAFAELVADHEAEISAREMATMDAEQHSRELSAKLEATRSQLSASHEEWQSRMNSVEATWRVRCEALEEQVRMSGDGQSKLKTAEAMVKAAEDARQQLREEFESFREMANNVMEAKDQQISRLLEENSKLQLATRDQPAPYEELPQQLGNGLEETVIQAAEQQILVLARQQAQREEEVAQCRRQVEVLQEEIAELEHENRLRSQQEALLKEELRNSERSKKRENVDMTYLKNVILKLLETGEVDALLPVIGMLLQFSPSEMKRAKDATSEAQTSEVPMSGAAAVVDAINPLAKR